MSILQKLTEGVQSRDLRAEGDALLQKWESTGLLEGLAAGSAKQGMAVLLENQAKELLREASAMAAGDVEGFAAVAFPIVRRVFGGLIANDLVSVQPMSLPSGLIFFLDFTHSGADRLGALGDASVYGGNVVGSQITGGVNLGSGSLGMGDPAGHYDLGHGASSPTGSIAGLTDAGAVSIDGVDMTAATTVIPSAVANAADKAALAKELRFDPDLLASTTTRVAIVDIAIASLPNIDEGKLSAIGFVTTRDDSCKVARRLTKIVSAAESGNTRNVRFYVISDVAFDATVDQGITITYPIADEFTSTGVSVGAVAGAAPWGLEEPTPTGGSDGAAKQSGKGNYQSIPEIDIKVDSIAVTAQTKKLKAKWTPELGQDLNAYHNLDAEVELTGILSEQIALEIDRELLSELVSGATAGTRYWSRAPGLFVNSSGSELGANTAAPDFTGTVSEWYETLIETINDVSAQIHRKTLRGGANFVVCSPEVANILEFTSGFRASVTADQDRGTIGAVKAGSLSKKFDVYVDPYFLRNVILVGRKGSSFLESGFVYAPYVPLQVTPTIFGTEDFVPRKGVMTRYAKKMVRPDMYGLVVVRGLLGEQGTAV